MPAAAVNLWTPNTLLSSLYCKFHPSFSVLSQLRTKRFISMLHHSNVDRLWAYWQAMHPEASTFNGAYQGLSRFNTQAGTMIGLDSPLQPFRQANGDWHTSRSVNSIATFGYAYQGLEYWIKSEAELQQSAVHMINSLYGPEQKKRPSTSSAPPKPTQTSSSKQSTRTSSKQSTATQSTETNSKQSTQTSSAQPSQKDITQSTSTQSTETDSKQSTSTQSADTHSKESAQTSNTQSAQTSNTQSSQISSTQSAQTSSKPSNNTTSTQSTQTDTQTDKPTSRQTSTQRSVETSSVQPSQSQSQSERTSTKNPTPAQSTESHGNQTASSQSTAGASSQSTISSSSQTGAVVVTASAVSSGATAALPTTSAGVGTHHPELNTTETGDYKRFYAGITVDVSYLPVRPCAIEISIDMWRAGGMAIMQMPEKGVIYDSISLSDAIVSAKLGDIPDDELLSQITSRLHVTLRKVCLATCAFFSTCLHKSKALTK